MVHVFDRKWLGSAVFTLLAATSVVPPAAAQQHAFDRGSYIIGGAAGLSSYSNRLETGGPFGSGAEEFRVTTVNFGPRVQRFVAPGLAVGGQLDLSHQRTTLRGSTNSWSSYGAGPAITYFFGGSEEARLVPYAGGEALYGITRFTGADVRAYTYRGSAGALYMLNGGVGLDAALYVRQMVSRMDGRRTETGPIVGLSIGVTAFAF